MASDLVMLITANQDQNDPQIDIDHHEYPQNEGFFNLKSKKSRGIAWFYIIGILFHAFYISSIFDIYFQSTLTVGVEPIPQTAEAPAKRVVLFLADGAKADVAYSFYEDGRPIAPFVRNLIATKASYGVSHPRGPTESRTCAIAIWAGFNEDPSAIMSGWKNNIVQYDHILNESTYAWAWGQHGVVDSLYSTRSVEPQTANISLADTNIDFADSGRPNLDDWALDSFENAFKRAKTDSELDRKLRSDKVAFFVHMIETDTQGHSNKPYSRKYKDAINHVDSRLEQAIKTVNDFYQDEKTLFVFTADHGMLNSGAHGDASTNNTRTPLVVWGPGVMGPVKNEHPTVPYDEFSELSDPWKLNDWVRKDIKQIDITPLVSSLIGIPVPVNSEGRLPLDYLAVSDKTKSQMYLANAQQLCAVYKKRNSMKAENEIYFSPYKRTVEDVDAETEAIQRLISGGKYDSAVNRTGVLIDDCVEGALYLQRYDWTLLFTVIIAGYVGWMLFGLARTLKFYSQVDNEEEKDLIALRWNRLFAGLYIIGAAFLFFYYYLKNAPWKYYGYTVFPVYFWFDLLFVSGTIFKGIEKSRTNVLYCLFYMFCVQIMVVTYYYRETLSLYYVGIAVWPLVAKNRFFSLKSVVWVITCIIMAIFPLLPPIDKRDFSLFSAGFILVAAMVATGCFYYRKELSTPLIVAAAYTPLTFLVAYNSDANLHISGLSPLNQLFAWSTLVVGIGFPIIFPMNSTDYFLKRLFAIFTCITPMMIILSTSYELLFFACFALHLTSWIYVEKDDFFVSKGWNKYLNFDYMRSGLIFLYYCHLAFFGMGNIASISGFTLDSIFRFTTQFVPFTMMGLLVIRIFLPFVLVACTFNALTRFSLRIKESSMIGLPVLSIADCMTIIFLFLVDNKGSWLQIGNSITRFIISSVFIILFLIFLGLGNVVMGKTDVDNAEGGKMKQKAKELLSVQDDENNIEL